MHKETYEDIKNIKENISFKKLFLRLKSQNIISLSKILLPLLVL
jgi:hypothetical protein